MNSLRLDGVEAPIGINHVNRFTGFVWLMKWRRELMNRNNRAIEWKRKMMNGGR